MMSKDFEEFKKKILHEKDDLFAILFINFLTVRLVYLMKKYKIKITPNQITYSRMFLIAPLLILLFFLAPLYKNMFFYLLALIFSYLFILSDWLDGQLARGTNQTSKNGGFLDSIADRASTIIFLTLLFSSGLFLENIFILYGSILLFIFKTFHLMIITKLFYFGVEKGEDNQKVFDGKDAFSSLGISKIFLLLKKVSKMLKIKRWDGTLGGAERFFITIMLPLILVLFGLNDLAIILLMILMVFFGAFLMIRIKNIFKGMN
jgi:phosphatidylglycerophosphate synthase|tara:strand:- start:642 stop:1427 length:786 start_codon:yes stop_codon:yes gene_type:complete